MNNTFYLLTAALPQCFKTGKIWIPSISFFPLPLFLPVFVCLSDMFSFQALAIVAPAADNYATIMF